MRDARSGTWQSLGSGESWDLVVIGGGVTGAGIFREAVRSGLRTLLVEMRDFAWATSSRSSKLVHGGLRYLKNGQFLLTRESVLERERLLKETQGLVTPLPFLMPNYKDQKPGRWTFKAGLTLYDLIAGKWEHRFFPQAEFRLMAPHLNPDNLDGGLRYTDAQTDDCRLVLRLIFESIDSGGQALNYVRAKSCNRKGDGTLESLTLADTLSGEEVRIQTRAVVNATGVWADRLRTEAPRRIRPLRGSHLTFPAWRLPAPQAITIIHPRDRRPCFLIPWEGATIFGTTDQDHDQDLDHEARITSNEVDYLMEVLQSRFPALNLTPEDIISGWAGVRPVISQGKDVDPSKESRDHEIWDDKGLMTITGGKLTTFRKMAFDLLETVRPYAPKFSLHKKQPVFDHVRVRWPMPVSERHSTRLVGRYGKYAIDLVKYAQPDEMEIIPGTATLWAELRWAARAEGVIHLDDLLMRRTRLGMLLPQGGRQMFPRIRLIAQAELGWDDTRWEMEAQSYFDIWHTYYDLPTGYRSNEKQV